MFREQRMVLSDVDSRLVWGVRKDELRSQTQTLFSQRCGSSSRVWFSLPRPLVRWCGGGLAWHSLVPGLVLWSPWNSGLEREEDVSECTCHLHRLKMYAYHQARISLSMSSLSCVAFPAKKGQE